MNKLTPSRSAVMATLFTAYYEKTVRFYQAKAPDFLLLDPEAMAMDVIEKMERSSHKGSEAVAHGEPTEKDREMDEYRQLALAGLTADIADHALSKGFYWAVVRNNMIDEIRKAQRRGRDTEGVAETYVALYGEHSHASTNEDTERAVLCNDLWNKFWNKIRAAYPKEAAILWDLNIEELSNAELRTKHNISGSAPYAIKYRILRAIKAIWPELEEAIREIKEATNGQQQKQQDSRDEGDAIPRGDPTVKYEKWEDR